MNNFTVPKPCHQNWQNMLPEEKGRFCTACKTKVYDFTKSSNEEIQKIYDQENGNICGKFDDTQVLQFTKFQNVVLRVERFTQNHFSKSGILVSAVSLLMGISGCTKKIEKQSVDSYGSSDSSNIVKDASESNFVLGEPVAPGEDSAQIGGHQNTDIEHHIQSNSVLPSKTVGKPVKVPVKPEILLREPLVGVPVYVRDTTKPKNEIRGGFPLGKIAQPVTPKTEVIHPEEPQPKNPEAREIQEVRVVGMVERRKD